MKEKRVKTVCCDKRKTEQKIRHKIRHKKRYLEQGAERPAGQQNHLRNMHFNSVQLDFIIIFIPFVSQQNLFF